MSIKNNFDKMQMCMDVFTFKTILKSLGQNEKIYICIFLSLSAMFSEPWVKKKIFKIPSTYLLQ